VPVGQAVNEVLVTSLRPQVGGISTRLYASFAVRVWHFTYRKGNCMEKNLSIMVKIVGIALIVLGAGLGIWGYELSGSVGSQITEAVTGADTDRVMTYYIAGAVSFAVGIFLFLRS
jgi:hypothetical protein